MVRRKIDTSNRCKPYLPKLYFPNDYRTTPADIGLKTRYDSEDDPCEEYTEFEKIVEDLGPRTSNRISKPSRKLTK